MKKTLLVVFFACLGLTTSACIVHSRPHHHRHHKARKHHRKHHRPHRKHCAPSHYWDGHKCRHKGRGHGARKHDY